jgi:hypothetical protein
MCRLLLGGQRARAGEAWSCTSPHADVIQVAISRRSRRLLMPMPTLLTACPRGARMVTCRPCRRRGAQAAEQANRRVGSLPMRNGSRHGEGPQVDVANSCIYNIYYTDPADEKLQFPATFCGIVYRVTWAGVSASLGIIFLPSSAYHSCTLRRPGSRVTRAGEVHRGALPVPPGQAPGRRGAEGRGHPRQGKIHCRHGRVTTRAYNAKGAM